MALSAYISYLLALIRERTYFNFNRCTLAKFSIKRSIDIKSLRDRPEKIGMPHVSTPALPVAIQGAFAAAQGSV